MQLIKPIIISLLLGLSLTLQAWHDPRGPGAASSAMGGCGVASNDFWSLNHNPSGLAWQKHAAFGVYHESPFLLKEMNYNHAAAVIPVNNGGFGVQLGYFGYSEYNEQSYGLSYGRKLGKLFAAGVQLNYLRTHIGNEYGDKGVLSFDVGIQYQLNDAVRLGAHVFNPLQVQLADYNEERIPAILSLGTEWQASEAFRFCAEVQGDGEDELQFKTGAEYLVNNWFALRIGLSTDPSIFSFGAGIHLGQLHLDFSSGMHQVLGYSPQFSLHYTFGKE